MIEIVAARFLRSPHALESSRRSSFDYFLGSSVFGISLAGIVITAAGATI